MGHSDQPPDLNLPITVMIVDDDHLVCATVARLLGRRRDLRVIGAFTSGFAALDAAVAQPPNVMVVDISMPAMGGRELTSIFHGGRVWCWLAPVASMLV